MKIFPSITFLCLIFLLQSTGFPAACSETGVFAVISAAATCDNCPALWVNHESAHQDIALYSFRGPRYDFSGVIQNQDTSQVITGVNTAGFALVYTTTVVSDSVAGQAHRHLLKKALGSCANLADFEELLVTHQARVNIGCFDANGDCALYEISPHKIIKYDINDSSDAPNGWLVRENFSFTCETPVSGSAWRYHRVNRLLEQAERTHTLDYKYLLQNIARDLCAENLDPYPLPYTGSFRDAPAGYIKTTDTINRHNTTLCVVIHGTANIVKSTPAALWIIPGEPVCGIAVPVWAQSGTIPKELSGKSISNMNKEVRENAGKLYHKTNLPDYIDMKTLAGSNEAMLSLFLQQENEIFRQTTEFIKNWHNNPSNFRELENWQKKMVYQAIKTLR
ncbi:MAG TPA: carcinine hydrolase/isopenicillin-N N-acyltransferase family protein [bacterium]|mgnify:CR=1 FL=1|nr:carcinine hydrolase/isopenicillin-N N-acyltransferase family protein [bacterium]HPN45441.1 carcinine hydrolase/isopenicillin-N N-acyltransferase family protein [bacterium]